MADRPNIVLVSWDSVRADHMPFHGYERNTCPFVAKKTEEGLVFEDAQVPAVGTAASFTGSFTGEHADATMLNPTPSYWASANEGRRRLPEELQQGGYHTGGFHFNALMSSSFGWNRGWNTYKDHLWDETSRGSSSDRESSNIQTRLFNFLQEQDLANFLMHGKKAVTGETPVRWEEMWDDIERFVQESPEPWFLWVLLIDTHHPYYVPKEYHEWPQPGIRKTYALNYVMRRHRSWAGERRQSIVNSYDNTMRYADEFTRRLSETVRSERGGEDTVFIVHSDHGDELGEHANYGHRPLMYDTVTRVPLVMWNVGESGVRKGPHTLLDLGNAILELSGSDKRLGQGRSLLSEDRDAVVVQNILSEGIGRTAAVVGSEWKVLYHPKGEWGHGLNFQEDSWEAYKRDEDPMEQNNRWGEHPKPLEERLRERLQAEVATIDDDGGLDGATEDRLRELGYIE